MQIALLATVLLAVVWLVALRPKPASVGGGAGAPAPAAQQAPTSEPAPSAPSKADTATGAGTADATGAAAAPDTATKQPRTGAKAARHAAAADPTVRQMRTALRQHKAIAIAFVAPSVSDARAVAGEIRRVSRFDGRAVSVAVPISQLSRFGFITRGVDVTVAPTTLIIAPNHEATTIVGFTDRFEIEQRLADALAAKR